MARMSGGFFWPKNDSYKLRACYLYTTKEWWYHVANLPLPRSTRRPLRGKGLAPSALHKCRPQNRSARNQLKMSAQSLRRSALVRWLTDRTTHDARLPAGAKGTGSEGERTG